MTLPHINYHHLRLFWEVARSGSLRIAATRLNLSQPTISAQIKALEDTLDAKLFDRSGRENKLTAEGRLVMERAGEIFSLGTELVRSLHGLGNARALRLNIGIADSLPKLVAWQVIRPAVKAFADLHLVCSEGSAQELLGQLAGGRLDMVLSDESAPSTLPIKVFSHLLGKSPAIFCAVPALARKLAPGFPACLKDQPMLLPASRTAWRHELDRWLDSHRIRPQIVAEFDDSALMKIAAADGLGVVPVAAAVLEEAVTRYGLKPIGRPVRCGLSCYLITLERAMRHPAVAVIAGEADRAFKERETA